MKRDIGVTYYGPYCELVASAQTHKILYLKKIHIHINLSRHKYIHIHIYKYISTYIKIICVCVYKDMCEYVYVLVLGTIKYLETITTSGEMSMPSARFWLLNAYHH